MGTELILTNLPTETLAAMAAEKAELVEQHGRKTVQAAIDCGRYLIEIKGRLGHGEWLPWLEENWQYSQVWASQFMRLANYNSGYNLADAKDIKDALRILGEAEEAAGTKRTRKPTEPPAAPPTLPAVEVIDTRPTKPAKQPQPSQAIFDDDDDLPPEEPPALPRTNTHHTPATAQKIDRGPEPSLAVQVSADPVRDLIDSTPFPLLINKIREALADCEESHRIRVAGMFQQLVNELNPPAETKAPTLPQMRAIIDERAKLPPADDRHLRPPVAAAASEWAAHKISMPKAKRYQSRTSWEACLSRMATLTFDRGADVVCEMIQRAIASGYQGWEFDLNNGRNSGRPASRTAVRTGRNFEAEMGPAIDISTMGDFS